MARSFGENKMVTESPSVLITGASTAIGAAYPPHLASFSNVLGKQQR
jgi:hypothetical protein